jgi:hypothetical protein
MIRIVHPHISRWFAAVTEYLEISTITPFEDIDFGIMNFGVYVIV